MVVLNAHDYLLAAPLLALAAGALVILLLDLLVARKSQSMWYVAGVGSVATAGYYLWQLWGAGEPRGFYGAMIMDRFGLVFAAILLGAVLLTVLLSMGRREEDKSGYLALVLWAGMGMVMMATAGNLMTIFLGLELLSLALYVAVAFDPQRATAREAALKYFVLGSVASSFILMGFAFIYGVTGTMDLAAIKAAAAPSALYFKVGIAMALVGFGFKMALVPFHVWAPDVYQGAPTATTAFMSVGTKAAAFAVMARFLMSVVPAEAQPRVLLPVAILSAASMLLGSTVGIWQTDLKRLMAYSGIAHAGYLIMAIPGLGAAGVSAAAYYMAAYLFTAMGVFAIIALLESEGEEGASFATLKGLFYRRPALGAAMALFMFANIGLPPTGGFIGKFLLAKAATTAIGTAPAVAWTLLIALFVSTGISAYVYLRVISTVFAKGAEAKAPARMAGAEDDLSLAPGAVRFGIVAVLVIAVLGNLWLGVLPGGVMDLLQIVF
ncbi:MAG TPA: NADH-quinone oxidoreductase subunit N [Symbiobacteriaceae bacterium]|jgi:NADH-quinone oxidoreductase subunit N|nr:NADH-quinone oxidoreductase subunit N [Symbiobacteriaceae bacterium]